MLTSQSIKKALEELVTPGKDKDLSRFFKTGKGQYGEGDKFIGVTVPNQRKVVRQFYKTASLKDIEMLLESPIHEHRLTALLILVEKYKRLKDEQEKENYVGFYLKHTDRVNNWDLVDSSAHKILGDYLVNQKDKSILYELAESTDLWEQRISIIATMAFLPQHDFKDILALSEKLMNHEHDLIHKAVGWLLREVGKRDIQVLRAFLDKHYKVMPRTMLRYAIEKMGEKERRGYLRKD